MARRAIPFLTTDRIGPPTRAQSQPRFRLMLIAAVLLAAFTVESLPVFANVTISSFTANGQATQVVVNWVTATEYNSAGFNLLRSTSTSGTFTKINAALLPSKCVACIGGSSYTYNDSNVTAGQTYYYKLETVDLSSATETFGPVTAQAGAAAPTATSAPPTATNAPPTATPVPPTATTAPPTATTVPPTATLIPSALPTSTPTPLGVLTSTPAPTAISATPTLVARAVPSASTKPKPAGSSNPSATPTASVTPETTRVAVVIRQPTQVTADENSDSATNPQPENRPLDQSYYVDRLMKVSLILSGLLGLGSAALGVTAFILFLRPYLR